MTKTAVLLTGPLGLGHEMMARCCAQLLERSGWRVRRLDSMSLLGPWRGGAGERAVQAPGRRPRPVRRAALRPPADREPARGPHGPGVQRQAGARPAGRTGTAARPTWCSACSPPARSAAARLKAEMPGLRTVVLCTDVAVHRIWAAEGTDLFLVTSAAAAASVRRYLPRAPVAVVPPPVRPEFYAAPPQEQARKALGVPPEGFCVLVIDSGWGFGPLVESVSALADAGVHVLAVAGRDRRIERRLRRAGRRDAPDHAVRFHRPGPRADGRRRRGGGPARRQHLRRGPGGGASPAASRRHAGPRAGQPAARTGAGPGRTCACPLPAG